jgi:hypothetical protein
MIPKTSDEILDDYCKHYWPYEVSDKCKQAIKNEFGYCWYELGIRLRELKEVIVKEFKKTFRIKER